MYARALVLSASAIAVHAGGCGHAGSSGAHADASLDSRIETPLDTVQLACGAAGTLDPTFGVNGVVSIFGTHGAGPVVAESVAIDDAARIVVVGGFITGPRSCVVARLLGDGSMDTTFGSNGIVVQSIVDDVCWFNDVALQPDGKIVAYGEVAGHTEPHAVIARYLTNGQLDSTFGDNGIVLDTTNVRAGLAAAIDDEGRVLVTGQLDAAHAAFDTRRLLQDGMNDIGFAGGSAQYTLADGPDGASDIAIDTDGNPVVVGGVVTAGGTGSEFAVVRYDPNGAMDVNFGSSGAALLAFGSHADAGGLAIDADGRLNIVGWAATGAPVVRLTHDGLFDPTFANEGWVVESTRPSLSFVDVALQGANVIATGSSAVAGTSSTVVVRYTAAGERDLAFGDSGFAESLPLTAVSSRAEGVAVQPDGGIVVVGGFGEPADMFVARYCP